MRGLCDMHFVAITDQIFCRRPPYTNPASRKAKCLPRTRAWMRLGEPNALLRKKFTGLNAATIELNFCVFMEVVVGWPVNLAFTKHTKAHPSCFRRRCQWALHSYSATSKQCVCNTCNHNLSHIFLPYHDETNRLGSSGTPVVTDSSHRPANLVTAFPLGGCCLKCTCHQYVYKRIYVIINSMIPNKVDRSIV